ncbi:MAG: hypothetical protein M3295_10035 [Chloroflexota bacterium]|nr:hypothetical protein [Chloroflexota bacterium]
MSGRPSRKPRRSTGSFYGTTTIIPWANIAAGFENTQIDAIAARIKALGFPVFMAFQQERETAVGTYGTAAEYAAAYRYVVKRFGVDGVTNVS